MTGEQLDAVMRYFAAMFAKWPQARSQETRFAYGQVLARYDAADVRGAIADLAMTATTFPALATIISAVRERISNRPAEDVPRITNPPWYTLPREVALRQFDEDDSYCQARRQEVFDSVERARREGINTWPEERVTEVLARIDAPPGPFYRAARATIEGRNVEIRENYQPGAERIGDGISVWIDGQPA